MANEELLLGISELLDKKIGPMEKRMDSMETTEQSLRGEIHKINLKLENNIEPRLQNIEQCYLDKVTLHNG